MSYDVFVVAAQEDRDMARLVVRRLRGLKMRVWFDAKATDDVFDAKESRAIDRSKSMLVLWSENAVKSAFVRAAAGQGYSKIEQGYPFIQAALDDVVPYPPYDGDERHSLKGFTSRTNPEGWFEIIARLEDHQGRKDLRDWLLIPTKDTAAQDAWRATHPDDPLAKKGQPVGVKKAETAPAVTGAVAPADEPAEPSPEPPPELAPAAPQPAVADKRPDTPAERPAPAPAATPPEPEPTPAAAAASVDRPPVSGATSDGPPGIPVIPAMVAAIAVLFLGAYAGRSVQASPAAMPAVANSQLPTCPPGTVPRGVLAEDTDILSPGPIIVDEPEQQDEPPQ